MANNSRALSPSYRLTPSPSPPTKEFRQRYSTPRITRAYENLAVGTGSHILLIVLCQLNAGVIQCSPATGEPIFAGCPRTFGRWTCGFGANGAPAAPGILNDSSPTANLVSSTEGQLNVWLSRGPSRERQRRSPCSPGMRLNQLIVGIGARLGVNCAKPASQAGVAHT